MKPLNERTWRIHDTLVEVAAQIDRTAAQVALNWVATQPGVTSTILGATKLAQLNDNLTALDFTIPSGLRRRLDHVSAIEPGHPYVFFGPPILTLNSGGVSVQAWAPARVTGGPAAPPSDVEAGNG